MTVLQAPWSNLTRWDGLIILSGVLLLGIAVYALRRRSWLKRLTEVGGIDWVQLEELRYGASPLVVDLRPADIYRGRQGHIRGSLNVPFEELGRRIKELDTKNQRPVVLVDEWDDRLLEAAAMVRARGITWFYLLKGGMKAWRRGGHPLDQFPAAQKR